MLENPISRGGVDGPTYLAVSRTTVVPAIESRPCELRRGLRTQYAPNG